MRVTVLCSDVSINSLGRAWILSEILGRFFKVELVGSRFGEQAWFPLRDRGSILSVPSGLWPRSRKAEAKLQQLITGDVIYAVKPLPSSFGLALRARERKGTPVVLDIDDDELAFRPEIWLRTPRRVLSGILHPNARRWTERILERIPSADGITVASSGLQRQYGGTLVPHARDTTVLRPVPEWSNRAKASLGLEGRRVVMFLGTPRPHKGIEDVVQALPRMRNEVSFVVIGADTSDPYVRSLRGKHPEVHFRPPVPWSDLVFVLQGADAMVVAQRATAAAINQVPAKLIDAMAVGKPIVATAVSDAPDILGNGRGVLVPASDPGAIARGLDQIFDSPEKAMRMGEAAREWCVRHASYESVEQTLATTIEKAFQRRKPL